jgi:NADPH:quinone reductase-like Zn-dependent oxidoreductase
MHLNCSLSQVQLKIRLAPINPADINVIEGVYPEKPSPRDDLGISESAYIGGNEGLAEVVSTGSDVSELKIGDWVVMAKPQSGTWTSKINSRPQDLIKVPKSISEVSAATISVRLSTSIPRALLNHELDVSLKGQPNVCFRDATLLCISQSWRLRDSEWCK